LAQPPGKIADRQISDARNNRHEVSCASAQAASKPNEKNTMPQIQKIVPCLWFDDQAEAAAEFYTSIFKDSRIVKIARYGEAGREIHGKAAGTVMTVAFELEGQAFTALNGGPFFKFNEAISFQIHCETQEEIDDFWEKLSEGGDEKAQQCGWLKDRYGASWQVVPAILAELVSDPDSANSQRAMQAMLQMKKLDIDALKRAYAG
jgi:predicted 3-demethylubiquinone-9 3-methyltransferase (glyoxalase superfamily)